MISYRITKNYSKKEVFDRVAPYYVDALTISGHKELTK